MRKNLILILTFAVIAGALLFFRFGINSGSVGNNPPVACTMEAKLCPDGSAVGRVGPNCEFAACPGAVANPGAGGILPFDSGMRGQVLLGPTCPVMRDPPDPQCADKPYATTIQVIRIGSPVSSPFATVKTDTEGNYSVSLPPGAYALQPKSGQVFPRCETKEVTVVPSKILEVNLSCDTGIR